MFGGQNNEYIPAVFIEGIKSKDLTAITSPIDAFIATWINDKTDTNRLIELVDKIPKHHNEYSFHNFIFIPILLYCLFDLANNINSNILK